ncbi:Uma2 family endonuclease [Spirulina major]|uniref:Uma2 family endonuclease n=1 Tax=Spirulina major TaxID=270636 RepID=UPI0009321103|nr:Uma2 family endonuclease [Spirulina major]
MVSTPQKSDIIYPERDGQPMADNTQQFRWIVTIKENLELLYADRDDVFVAGDLLWYPVMGEPKIRVAPDALVVFGRPKGDRGSYRQWQEDNIAPQVVFEILSPGNRFAEMVRKLEFYDRYDVEEYYIYNPDTLDLTGLIRQDEKLAIVDDMAGWVSPRLQIRFELTAETLELYGPTGDRFLTYVELGQLRAAETQRADAERDRANQAEARLAALKSRLQALGIDPESDA